MPRPNWFLAFPVDGAFVLGLPALPSHFRRFHPEDVHLTLAFLGGCSEQAARGAFALLDERLNRAPVSSLHISLGEVVPMGGSVRAYTALSALVDRGNQALIDCLASHRDALLEAATGRREKRAPKPHITIARPRGRATAVQREAGLAWATELGQLGAPARLDRVALYTWSEKRAERLFRIVSERGLASAPTR